MIKTIQWKWLLCFLFVLPLLSALPADSASIANHLQIQRHENFEGSFQGYGISVGGISVTDFDRIILRNKNGESVIDTDDNSTYIGFSGNSTTIHQGGLQDVATGNYTLEIYNNGTYNSYVLPYEVRTCDIPKTTPVITNPIQNSTVDDSTFTISWEEFIPTNEFDPDYIHYFASVYGPGLDEIVLHVYENLNATFTLTPGFSSSLTGNVHSSAFINTNPDVETSFHFIHGGVREVNFSVNSKPPPDSWVIIDGIVKYDGSPVCAMVLANGQYAFTCSGDGKFIFAVPLDANGEVTIQVFCSGRIPYRSVINSNQFSDVTIELTDSTSDTAPAVNADFLLLDTDKVRITGSVLLDDKPICTMVLANGQYVFTCSGDGSFDLEVPLDNEGGVTFYSFCSGLQPYKRVYTYDELGSSDDNDNDGYSSSQGDCDDNDPNINPGAIEICGDGIDQDCNGTDMVCSQDDSDADGYTVEQGDCNDSDPNINPGSIEIANDGIDQDCDGQDLITGSFNYDGQWSGTTSQGEKIEFNVLNNRITFFNFEYHFSGSDCSGDGYYKFTSDYGMPIMSNTINIDDL